MPICPQGHTSEADDYCDTCGEPMTSRGPSSASRGPSSGPLDLTGLGEEVEAGAVVCPICDTPAAPGALFCENCGYDFTTGTAPAPLAEPGAVEEEVDVEPEGDVESEGAPEEDDDEDAPEEDDDSEEPEAEEPEQAKEPEPAAADLGAGEAASSSFVTGATTPERAWVAELWVDPDWYALQRPEDPLPSAAAPKVVALRGASLLIGRPSRSRGVTPDVDCGTDAGVSRRHAELTTDGQRWWLEDVGSANGTYVAAVGEPIPDAPIPAGTRVELEEGSRVYLGGWTRLVVREAFPGEA